MYFSSPVVKEGPLKVYDKQKRIWKQCFVRLRQCGWIHWFDKPTSPKPINGTDLRVVAAFFAYGELLYNIPQRPTECAECDMVRIFAAPLQPKWESDFYFFMCDSDAEMCSWITSIFTMLGERPPERYQVPLPTVAYPPVPDEGKLFAKCNVQPVPPPPPPPVSSAPTAPGLRPQSPTAGQLSPTTITLTHPTILCRIVPPGNAQANAPGQPVALVAVPILPSSLIMPGNAPLLHRTDSAMKDEPQQEKKTPKARNDNESTNTRQDSNVPQNPADQDSQMFTPTNRSSSRPPASQDERLG